MSETTPTERYLRQELSKATKRREATATLLAKAASALRAALDDGQ